MNRIQKINLGLAVLSAALGVFVASLGLDYATLKFRVKFAEDQTHIFDEMRQRALSADASNAGECLSYVVNYYPSGSKQITGSPLDLIVERERTHVVNDIVAFLRTKTGQDLGNNPSPWIQKFTTSK